LLYRIVTFFVEKFSIIYIALHGLSVDIIFIRNLKVVGTREFRVDK